MMKMYSSDREKPILEKILALLLHHGQVYGEKKNDKIEIIECDNFETSIDIHSKFDLYLAEKTIEYFKKFEPARMPNTK